MTVTATKYAKVLWELCMPFEIVQSAKELLDKEPVLKEVLDDPTVFAEQKRRAVDRIFPQELSNFMKFLSDEQDVGYFDEIAEAYEALQNEKNQTIAAKLTYVTPPDAEQAEGMKAFLRDYFHVRNVELEFEKDEALLGGFVLSANNQEWDWSLRQRIAQMQADLSRR